MITWPFDDLRPNYYGAILADPPWTFRTYSRKGEGKSPQSHYACMALADIKALPVADLAAPDCALVMWATAPMLPHAMEALSAWGFKYKSAGTWAKQSKAGRSWAFGTGFIYRSAAEFWLLGTRGKPRGLNRSTRNLIVAPVREHSRKPDEMAAGIERLFAGPYADLFARQRRPGWDAWGNEVDKFSPVAAAGNQRLSPSTAPAADVAGAHFDEAQ